MKDNIIVQVPQPLIHFPCFFVSNTPEEGFFYSKPNKYGDLVSIQAPRTPRIREMIVFLAALTFIQSREVDKDSRRIQITIPAKAWLKAAGFGRTRREKDSFEEAVTILSKIVYSVDIGGAVGKQEYEGRRFQKRTRLLPFRKAIFPGLFGDVEFDDDGTITIHVLQDFVEDLDVRALRVSLTHVLSMRGHIARAMTFMMYGRKSWSGSWDDLAEMVRIEDWSEKKKQRQALRKALKEMESKGFHIEYGKSIVKITRNQALGALIDV